MRVKDIISQLSLFKPRKPLGWRGLPANKPVINVALFLATIFSTFITGGWAYALVIISILLCHEMGHYFMCRKYRVPATLPFFIPMPLLNPFGTMGAIIQMRGSIPNRRALFDIGAAGPLAGFIIAVPALFWGIGHSRIVHVSEMNGTDLVLGESLLFKFMSYLALGSLPEGYDIVLHPAAFAGWAGLLVTSLNLLPIGQLDGGHIVYSMLGGHSKRVHLLFLGALGGLVIAYPGWALLFILLLLFGRSHPPSLDDTVPLDIRRKIVGIFIFLIFLLSFTPIPFKFNL
jgi:membrane-associated protease RseP (regulator of RpoE activity)